jgi:hypothetical protein
MLWHISETECELQRMSKGVAFDETFKDDFCIKSQQEAIFLNFILVKNSTYFEQTYCPSSGVLTLYSQQLVFVILVILTVC